MKNKRILLVVAHPDDETVCAGTLIKQIEKGTEVTEIILTGAEEGGTDAGTRREEMLKASKFLGMKEVIFMEQPDLGLTYSKDLMLRVVEQIRRVKPDWVILMYKDDFHPDHRAAFQIGIEAVKWAASGVRPEIGTHHRTGMITMMGGMWPTRPDLLVDVTEVVERKMEMLKLHGSQVNKKLEEFERGSMAVYGYHLRTPEGRMAETFEFCPEFPSIKLLEL